MARRDRAAARDNDRAHRPAGTRRDQRDASAWGDHQGSRDEHDPGSQADQDVCISAIGQDSNDDADAFTTKTGSFRLAGLAAAKYDVQFDPTCFGRQLSSFIGTQQPGVTTGIDAVLQPFGGIVGAVTTTERAPVSGECVTAVPQNPQPDPVQRTTQPAEIAISARNGRFSLLDLPPGQYKIKFSTGCGATGFATQWWHDAGSAGKATIVTVEPATVTSGISGHLHR